MPASPKITYKKSVPGVSVNWTTECPARDPPWAVPSPVVVEASLSSTIIFPVASNLRTFWPLLYALEA